MVALSLRFRLSLILAGVLALLLALDAGLTLLGAGRRVDPEIADATALTRDVLSEAVQNVKPGADAPAGWPAISTGIVADTARGATSATKTAGGPRRDGARAKSAPGAA